MKWPKREREKENKTELNDTGKKIKVRKKINKQNGLHQLTLSFDELLHFQTKSLIQTR